MNPEPGVRDFWIDSEWPAPGNVRAGATTRLGGISARPYATLNLALHVGDDAAAVLRNRQLVRQGLELPSEPGWLNQQHGRRVIDIGRESARDADGAYTDRPGQVCAVLTADCIALLLADTGGTEVAAVHVGWRGFCAGVVKSALARFRCPSESILAWLGPHIGADNYLVDEDVRAACRTALAAADRAFTAAGPGRWHADLGMLLRMQLNEFGLRSMHGSMLCTYRDPDRFYSHRRQRPTGRMAGLIWLDH